MRKKLVKVAFITTLLFSAVAEVIFVNMSEANIFPIPTPSGIRIERDGSLNWTDKIQRNGETYIFTDDIRDTIVVLRDNIVIDGAGHSLNGHGISTGVFLQGVKGVTVKNLKISNFSAGIYSTWTWNETDGVTLKSKNNNISDNLLQNNERGIGLDMYTTATMVERNTIENGTYGISIYYSNGNTFRNNTVNGNKYNLAINCGDSGLTSKYVNDIDTSNTVDGKPVYYWINQHDKTVPPDAGYVALIGCTGITVQGANLTHNSQGILMVATSHSTITGNHFANNRYGIVLVGALYPCTYDKITENTIAENENGIYIYGDWLERGAVIHTLTFHHNNIINNSVQLTSYSYGGIWDDGSEGNYWSNYNGTDANGNGIGDAPYVVIESYIYDDGKTYGSTDIDHYPLMYPWGPPPILMINPENETYSTANIPLNFTVREPTSWIGYSLDGKNNVTITGNITLSGLSSGLHNLTLYATDMYGNIGNSEIIYFSVEVPFPTTLVATVSVAAVAVVGVGLLVYFKKRKH